MQKKKNQEMTITGFVELPTANEVPTQVWGKMSTFSGLMNEYRNISIDRFDERNMKSTVYFLSHKHEGR